MVLFGAQEPKLYQLLFMQDNRNAVSFDDVFGELGSTAETCIRLICEEYGMGEAEAKLLFENVWIYTFGVGALCATRVCHFFEEPLKRLGILTIVLPTGCAIVASIVTGIVAGFLKVEVRASMEAAYSNAGNITLGLMFLLGALLCRSAAEQTQAPEN